MARQQWPKIEYVEAVHRNCKRLARQMIEALPKGTLILADLGYFGWAGLLIAQILPALQLEIAARAEAVPFEVSLALMVEYLPQFACTAQDPSALFISQGR